MRRAARGVAFLGLSLLAAAWLAHALGRGAPADRAEAAVVEALGQGRPARWHDAANAWRDALALSPADPFAWTGLAWTEAARGAPAPYVDRLMDRAAALAPQVPEIARARAAWTASRPPPAAPAP
ncbi:hypothetical protein [Roseospira goensis]|uniref:Putative TPR repeat methyltransferase n=1 Tax=Roseospira goensis TaxID=391922 RepID=A0A7W6RYZ7_9PROT|nr:hypothetical protein [Roseospira goensis]MBB4285830.1 putative TPR repeat methyltransferase [Roseospira goensis]